MKIFTCSRHSFDLKHLTKPILVMKLIVFLIILSCFKVTASVYAQDIVVKAKQEPIIVVFDQIQKQTNYIFFYDEELLSSTSSISLSIRDKNLTVILDALFKSQPLSYQIVDKTIVVKRKEKSILNRITEFITPIKVSGKITDEKGQPMADVSIRIKGTDRIIRSDKEGHYTIDVPDETTILQFSFVGYQLYEVIVGDKTDLIVKMKENLSDLGTVDVVNTGYQSLPKERATGSFTVVENKLLNRAVSPDLVSRLNSVTNGLYVDPNGEMTVRGRSTIFSNRAPLIVMDNFPFEGDISTINPNDIENVTILKDAAAASIWGVRASNGVIVITTKKGRLNQKATVELNANLSIGVKPDLYYKPQLSSSDFIDLEKIRFQNGEYTSVLSNNYDAISPVIIELQKAKLDPSYATQAATNIDKLRGQDIRNQLSQYFYRNSTRQQYSANVKGGGTAQTYFFSAGYDKNLPNAVNLSDSRITLKANNSYVLLNGKLTLSTDINFTKSKSQNSNISGYTPYLPYEQIADANGNALETIRRTGLRKAYTDTVGNGKLLDWKYRPLEELNSKSATNESNLTDYRILLGGTYKIFKPLSISANYQYFSSNRKIDQSYSRNSFFTRNTINSVSKISTTNVVTRPIPLGDIYTPSFASNQGNYGRAQLNFNQVLGAKNEVNAIAGYEIREDQTTNNSYTVYGYFPGTGQSSLVVLNTPFPYYYGFNTLTIGNNSRQGGTINRYLSYYADASYAYDGRYILSGSYRKDESNLFGVRANQKGVPLWSTGLAWNLHKESFFKFNWLSRLQLRATYGYNGNVNNTISAYLTAQAIGPNPIYSGTTYYEIINPPNDNLRWERVKNINIGIDFAAKDNRVSGSIEYYLKNGIDLIGSSPIAPQSGVSTYTGNSANTHTSGIDIQLNSINLDGNFKWYTTALFNAVKDKVTEYRLQTGLNSAVVTVSSINPVVGYPVNSIFAYRWKGLNVTGNPQGELNGAVSTNYAAIENLTNYSQLDYHGSAVPTIFGSLRNTFSYKNIELSVNISYKLNYYFRRSSFTDYADNHSDYTLRWQKAGDELITSVPALLYPSDYQRSSFYQYSSALIEKGDHIRLQDIQLNYTFSASSTKKFPFSRLNIYCYATNLGILWRANKKDIDPDLGGYGNYPAPTTIAFGLKTNF